MKSRRRRRAGTIVVGGLLALALAGIVLAQDGLGGKLQ
jgi:hypothetical protein